MKIETARCLLRPWCMDDKAALVRIANNPKIARNMTNIYPSPYTVSDAECWLNARSGDDAPYMHIAIEIGGNLAGGIGVHPREGIHERTAELGYWLGEAFWGQGYMTEVVKAVIPYAFETFDLHRLEACQFGWNPASGKVLEKAGFRLEGCLREAICKDGKFTDRLLYGLLREEAF